MWQLSRTVGVVAAGGAVRGLAQIARGERFDLARAMLGGKDAERLVERLSKMRGAVMKLGQLVSLDGSELLPPELAGLLGDLRDQAHQMPFSQLAGVLEQEYGSGWDLRFKRFAFEPIAAASIGQVHRAETRDGRLLAIKVQYPGVRQSIDSDIDNLRALVRLLGLVPAGVELDGAWNELRAQLHAEADYAQEARAAGEYRRLLGDTPDLMVPRIHEDLSTGHLLAMDFIDGVSVEQVAGLGRDERDRVATCLAGLVLQELCELGLVQTDPNYANYLYCPDDGRIALLDFGATRAVTPRLVQGYLRMARAAVAADRHAVCQAAESLGYLLPEDPPEIVEGLSGMILTAAEPLRGPDAYDFGTSTLFRRMHDLGRELVYERGFNRPPPPETMFLHRKFVGTFLLCARVRARVNAALLLARW